MPVRSPQKQTGTALLLAVLVVGLAGTAAAAIVTRLQLDDRRTANLLQRDQAWRYALAAEAFAELALREDALNSTTSYPSSPLYIALPPTPVDDGVITGRIHDLGGCLNLNDVANPDRLSQIEALLGQLQLDSGYAQIIADWVDEDASPRVFGAEDGAYLTQTPWAYRAANQSLTSGLELNRIDNGTSSREDRRKRFQLLFTPTEICANQKSSSQTATSGLAALFAAGGNASVQPFCVLPAGAPLNVNMMSPQVMASLHVDLDLATAEALVETACSNGAWDNINDFFAEQAWEDIPDRPTGLTVQSEYFLAELDATVGTSVGSTRVLLYSLLHRDPASGATRVLARSRNLF